MIKSNYRKVALVLVFAATSPQAAHAQDPASCQVMASLSARYSALPPELRVHEALTAASISAQVASRVLNEASAAKALQEQSLIYNGTLAKIQELTTELKSLEKFADAEKFQKYTLDPLIGERTLLKAKRLEWEYDFVRTKSKLTEKALARNAEQLAEVEAKIAAFQKGMAAAPGRIQEIKTALAELTSTALKTRIFGVELAGALRLAGKVASKAALVLTVIDVLSTPSDSVIQEDWAIVDPLGMRKYVDAKNPYLRNPMALLAMSQSEACVELKKDTEVEARFLEIASLIHGKDVAASVDPRAFAGAKPKAAPAKPITSSLPPNASFAGSADSP